MSNKSEGIFSKPSREDFESRYGSSNNFRYKMIGDYLQEKFLLEKPSPISQGPMIDDESGKFFIAFDESILQNYLRENFELEELIELLKGRYEEEVLEESSIKDLGEKYIAHRTFSFFEDVISPRYAEIITENKNGIYFLALGRDKDEIYYDEFGPIVQREFLPD